MSFLRYFSGFRLEGSKLHVVQTGARIDIGRKLFGNVISVIKVLFTLCARNLGRFLRRAPRKGSIAFTPQPSGPWYNIWLVAKYEGFKIVTDPQRADHIFVFDDSTHSDEGSKLSSDMRMRAINDRIDDISKNHVADVFEEVFGYSVGIDPTVYSGLGVCKSDVNGTHDGVVISCPIPPSEMIPGQTYQRLVDSTYNGQQSEDLRFAFVFGELAVVYHKFKQISDRFGMNYQRVDVKRAADVFSPPEIELLTKFCLKMGLDFGAVDVMRDKQDGKVYIVDVNKTCMPVLSLRLTEQKKALGRMGEVFSRKINAPR